MPACQAQIAAYKKRVLGTCIHTPAGTGGLRSARCPTTGWRATWEKSAQTSSHPYTLWSEGCSSPFLAMERAELIRAENTCLSLGGGVSEWKQEPGVQSHDGSPQCVVFLQL